MQLTGSFEKILVFSLKYANQIQQFVCLTTKSCDPKRSEDDFVNQTEASFFLSCFAQNGQ